MMLLEAREVEARMHQLHKAEIDFISWTGAIKFPNALIINHGQFDLQACLLVSFHFAKLISTGSAAGTWITE